MPVEGPIEFRLLFDQDSVVCFCDPGGGFDGNRSRSKPVLLFRLQNIPRTTKTTTMIPSYVDRYDYHDYWGFKSNKDVYSVFSRLNDGSNT